MDLAVRDKGSQWPWRRVSVPVYTRYWLLNACQLFFESSFPCSLSKADWYIIVFLCLWDVLSLPLAPSSPSCCFSQKPSSLLPQGLLVAVLSAWGLSSLRYLHGSLSLQVLLEELQLLTLMIHNLLLFYFSPELSSFSNTVVGKLQPSVFYKWRFYCHTACPFIRYFLRDWFCAIW